MGHCSDTSSPVTVTPEMGRILLMGNPNVGKSVVFSRLTGLHAFSSNYPGTTVEFMQGVLELPGRRALVIDAPGVYGLEATCKAEEIALSLLKEGGTVINVVDATNLERNLHLTLHLLELNVPMIVALNIWDDAKHKGIHIDVAELERFLGVPVVPTVAVTGEGVKELTDRLPDTACELVPARTEAERWTEVGRITASVQTLEHRHHTWLEWLGDLSVKPATGIPIAAIVLVVSFAIIRIIGEGLIGYVCEPLFEVLWKPLMMALGEQLGPGTLLHTVVIGKLIDGTIDFKQSFGILTTGLFVPIAMVVPYVLSFYLALGFLEDFGYLPRLAVLLDVIMHRMGLHGWAIIPMLLGFGCNVPGIMATRVLENYRERLIAATLVCVAVPCAALQAMAFGLLGRHGLRYVLLVYFILFVVWLVLGRLLNAVLKGSSPELILEIPPYRIPSVRTVFAKLWARMKGLFREAVPVIVAAIVIVNILYAMKMFDALTNLTAPIVTNVFGLPKEAVVALVVGFLRKDVAVGMLGTLDLSVKQLVISVTILAISFPCIATFTILAKELGIRGLLQSTAIMLVTMFLVGGALNIIL